MSPHADIVDIDAVRCGHGRREDVEHVRRCDECSTALRQLEELSRDLAVLAKVEIAVPEEIERRILWEARKRALTVRRRQRWWRPGWAAAAAAAVLLGLTSLLRLAPEPQPDVVALARRPKAAAPLARVRAEDIDGDGRIDILDAFALARAVEAGGGADVNGDGVVDQRDVQVLADAAVRLGGA